MLFILLLSCQTEWSCPPEMILLDGGTYSVGESQPTQTWHQPSASVKLEPYCMDIYEFPNQKGKMPMGNVTWTEAKSLCETEGKRLCSSAEWGRACRGLEKRTVSYGEQYDRNKCNTAINGSGPGVGQPAPIKPSGIFPDCKSPEGIYDLNGSLSEWVSDPWSDFAEPFNPDAKPDPKTWRTLRGGTMWSQTFYGQDCTSRHGHHGETWKNVDDGFRCCANAVAQP